MLRLDNPVNLSSSSVGLANLPLQGSDIIQTHPDDFISIPIGWGKIETGAASAKLLEVPLLVNRSSANAYEFRATSSDGNNGSVCMGDSGGPTHVGVREFGTGTVIGLSSYVQIPAGATGCNFPNVPSVFTRVSTYRDAVDSAVAFCGTANCL